MSGTSDDSMHPPKPTVSDGGGGEVPQGTTGLRPYFYDPFIHGNKWLRPATGEAAILDGNDKPASTHVVDSNQQAELDHAVETQAIDTGAGEGEMTAAASTLLSLAAPQTPTRRNGDDSDNEFDGYFDDDGVELEQTPSSTTSSWKRILRIPTPEDRENIVFEVRASSVTNEAVAREPGSLDTTIDLEPSMRVQGQTANPPTLSPMTPDSGTCINIEPAPLPDPNSFPPDPKGTLARRLQTYESFKSADTFLEENIHPIDDELVGPHIHATYVIKTVTTIKCDECNSKLERGGELYQCKTCSAQICQTCVEERFAEEVKTQREFRRKIAEEEADETGTFSYFDDDYESKMGYRFDWQGPSKHLPFRQVYLDRRTNTGHNRGPWEGEFPVLKVAGEVKVVHVQLLADTPRRRGTRKSEDDEHLKPKQESKISHPPTMGQDEGPSGAHPGKGKPGREERYQALAQTSAKTTAGATMASNDAQKDEGKGKEKATQDPEQMPVDVDESDGEIQFRKAVFGGRPAGEKLKHIQKLARENPTTSQQNLKPRPTPRQRQAPSHQDAGIGHDHAGNQPQVHQAASSGSEQQCPGGHPRPVTPRLRYSDTLGNEFFRGTPTAAFPGQPVNYIYKNTFNSSHGNSFLPFNPQGDTCTTAVGPRLFDNKPESTMANMRPYLPIPSLFLPEGTHAGIYFDETEILAPQDAHVFVEREPTEGGTPVSVDHGQTYRQAVLANPDAHTFLAVLFAAKYGTVHVPGLQVQPHDYLRAHTVENGFTMAQAEAKAREQAHLRVSSAFNPHVPNKRNGHYVLPYDTKVAPLIQPTPGPPQIPTFGDYDQILEPLLFQQFSTLQHESQAQPTSAGYAGFQNTHVTAPQFDGESSYTAYNEAGQDHPPRRQSKAITIESDSDSDFKYPLNVVNRAPRRKKHVSQPHRNDTRSRSPTASRISYQGNQVRDPRDQYQYTGHRSASLDDSGFGASTRPQIPEPQQLPFDPISFVFPGPNQLPTEESFRESRHFTGFNVLPESNFVNGRLSLAGLPVRYAMVPEQDAVPWAVGRGSASTMAGSPMSAAHSDDKATSATRFKYHATSTWPAIDDPFSVAMSTASTDGDTEVLSDLGDDNIETGQAKADKGKGRAVETPERGDDPGEMRDGYGIDNVEMSDGGEGHGEEGIQDADDEADGEESVTSEDTNNQDDPYAELTVSPTPNQATRGLDVTRGRLRSGKEFQ